MSFSPLVIAASVSSLNQMKLFAWNIINFTSKPLHNSYSTFHHLLIEHLAHLQKMTSIILKVAISL